MTKLIQVHDPADLVEAERKGFGKGVLCTGIVMAVLLVIASTKDEYLKTIGRTHGPIVKSVRDQFKDVGQFFVMHDEKNPAHLCYTDAEGYIVYSITIAQIDSNNAIIVLFKDGDGDGILNAEREAPLYFANTEATMQHIESLEK